MSTIKKRVVSLIITQKCNNVFRISHQSYKRTPLHLFYINAQQHLILCLVVLYVSSCLICVKT